MAILLTGSTGYIGAHVAANLLRGHDATLNLLVRGRDPDRRAREGRSGEGAEKRRQRKPHGTQA